MIFVSEVCVCMYVDELAELSFPVLTVREVLESNEQTTRNSLRIARKLYFACVCTIKPVPCLYMLLHFPFDVSFSVEVFLSLIVKAKPSFTLAHTCFANTYTYTLTHICAPIEQPLFNTNPLTPHTHLKHTNLFPHYTHTHRKSNVNLL
jgi:hypothetical protein